MTDKFSKLKDNMYLQLFISFFKLGLFTIGGGMAMVPLIQGIVVDEKHWMTDEEAVDCIAVSQGLPGVIAINMATYIGHQKKGILGAVAATTGVILPSFVIIILIVKILSGIGDNQYVNGALVGIKAAATGLITFSAYKLGKQVLKGWFQVVLAAGAFIAIIFFGANAIWPIVGGIVLGLAYTALKSGRDNGGTEE